MARLLSRSGPAWGALLAVATVATPAIAQGYLSHPAEHAYFLGVPLQAFNQAVFNSSVAWSQPAAPGADEPGFGDYLDAARRLSDELGVRIEATRTTRDTTLVAAFRAFHASLSTALAADGGDNLTARNRFWAFRAVVQPAEQQLAAASRAFSERFASRFTDHTCTRANALLKAVENGTVTAGESFRGHTLTLAQTGMRSEWVAVLTGGSLEMDLVKSELSACKTAGAPWARREVQERDGDMRVRGHDFDPAGLSAPAGRDGPTGVHVRLETRTTADRPDQSIIRFRGAIR